MYIYIYVHIHVHMSYYLYVIQVLELHGEKKAVARMAPNSGASNEDPQKSVKELFEPQK